MHMVRFPESRLRFSTLLLAACAVLALSACGTRVIRDQTPFVQINGLALGGEGVVLDLGVRNVNEVAMDLVHVDVRLTLLDTELAAVSEVREGSIIASGSETLQFRFPGTTAGRELLHDLQDGNTSSLPYRLEGSILTADDHRFPFTGAGHLYPVPGRPGQFR